MVDDNEIMFGNDEEQIEAHHKEVIKAYGTCTSHSGSPLKMNIFCNYCRQDTNHYCKAVHYRIYQRDYREYSIAWEFVGYRFWVCAGCEHCVLEMNEINDVEGYTDFYPERSKFHVTRKTFVNLPSDLENIYHETLRAFNNDLPLLCASGLRALIEGICEDKGIKGKNLEVKINGLINLLPDNIVNNLHDFRFIGNDALHKLKAPRRDELRLAIEICEDLLNFLYELDYKASRLSNMHKPKDTFSEFPF